MTNEEWSVPKPMAMALPAPDFGFKAEMDRVFTSHRYVYGFVHQSRGCAFDNPTSKGSAPSRSAFLRARKRSAKIARRAQIKAENARRKAR